MPELPNGRILEIMLRRGIKMGVSSRSLGAMDEQRVVRKLRLITWDAVHEPSVSEAIMKNLLESLEYEFDVKGNETRLNLAKESLNEYNNIKKQKLYTTEEKRQKILLHMHETLENIFVKTT